MKFKFLNIILLLIIFTVFSCDSDVALGSRLNLDPPAVTIEKPETMSNISDPVLIIEGTAKDYNGIEIINLSVECTNDNIDPWKIEYRAENGTWVFLGTSIEDYEGDFAGTWEEKDGIVYWTLSLEMPANSPQGEYVISAGAVNTVKNEGPVLQRRVTIDLTPPVVEIFIPDLTKIKSTLDGYNIRTPADLSKINADNLRIQYKIEDQFSINTFTLIIKDESGTERFSHFNPGASWNGIVEIDKDDFNPPLPDTKSYLQILTIATDKAGNPEDNALEDQGWLIWWPEAVKPWSEGLGGTSPGSRTEVYPGDTVYGQSYGKYGIDKIVYEIINEDGMVQETPPVTVENIPQGGTEKSTFFNFNFAIPSPDTKENYTIKVTVYDIIGNETLDLFYVSSEPISNLGPLMLSYGGSPSGTYGLGAMGLGEEIEITVILREPVLVNSDSTMTLDVGTAELVPESNRTDRLTYRYKVKPGDDTDLLKIIGINVTSHTKPDGTPLASPAILDVSELRPLSDYTSIIIKTDIPVLLAGTGPSGGVYYNPATSILTLTYNKNIYKGAGSITLTQQGTYLAPAVLTKTQYEKFGGSSLGNYYTLTVNGASAAGVIDTREKYVLNYNINTNNASLINILTSTANNANRVVIPVASGAVEVKGAVMTIDLSEAKGYVPNVKGVSYDITYPEGFVIDTQNNPTPELNTGSRSLPIPGVNEPFIRVRRDNETIATSGTNNLPVANVNTGLSAIPTSVNLLTAGTSGTGTQLGIISIGSQEISFIGYRQATAPTGTYAGTYINIRDIVYGNGTTTGTGRIAGASFWRSNAPISGNQFYYRVHWGDWWGGNQTWDGIAYTKLIETANNEGEALTDAIKNLPAPDNVNIWVSFLENQEATQYENENNNHNGRGGIVLYNVWVQGATLETTAEITGTRTFNNMTAIQPVTAEFKIDCQTPGADIKYTVKDVASEPFAGPFNMGNHARPAVSMPALPTTTTGEEYDPEALPSLGDEDNLNGSIYGIIAIAWNGTTESKPAYEVAARSVISFSNITEAQFWSTGNNNLNSQAGAGNKLQLWIRGGDNTEGQNSTPGFPLSWSTADLKGARLMTSPGNSSTDTGTWYWVSWNVNVPAYFQFLAGVTPATTGLQDIIDNGPVRWSWSKNAWSLQKREFVLYPGNSLVFTRNTRVSSPATDNFEFYNSFSGSRQQ